MSPEDEKNLWDLVSQLRRQHEESRVDPYQGGYWRQGRKVPRNLYWHADEDDPDGYPVAMLPTEELAEFLCQAANAYRQ